MLTEYAGWQISDDKQREIEARLVKRKLLAELDAQRTWQPSWLRLRFHHLGVRLERWGGRLQVQAEKCNEMIADEQPRMGASI